MWATRAETTHDRAAVRRVLIAAFPTTAEADLVDHLRGDPEAWIPELSVVAADERGQVVALSLMTRCHVGGDPALALAPCAVLPAGLAGRRLSGSRANHAARPQSRRPGRGEKTCHPPTPPMGTSPKKLFRERNVISFLATCQSERARARPRAYHESYPKTAARPQGLAQDSWSTTTDSPR